MPGIPTAPMALRLYEYLGYTSDELGPIDAANDYAVATMCTAQMAPFETVGRIAFDSSLWADPVNAPDELIRNMAMRAGLVNAHGETIDRLRDRLVNPPAFEVGSSEAIAEAVRGILGSPTVFVRIESNYDPAVGSVWGHTTVTVDPDDVGSVTLAQIQTAAEEAAPGWVVIHAVIANGDTIDELVDDIDNYTGPIAEL